MAPAPRARRAPGGRERDVVSRASKRALDIVGSAALLVLCAPILLIIAVLVKWTSKGPVFFRQERVGQHARPFRMLKFRTMQVDAGHEIHQQYVTQYIQGQGASNAASGGAPAVFKLVGDPRVTKLGSFLRRSSLDEVPQFWNVLKGEMSLVGPRPPVAVRGQVLQTVASAPRVGCQAGHHGVVASDRPQSVPHSMRWSGWTSAMPGPARSGSI